MSTVVTVIHKNLNLPNHQLYIPDQGRKSCECYDACITGHGQVEVDGGIGPRQYPFASATDTSSLISLTLSVRNLTLPPLLDSKPSLLQIKTKEVTWYWANLASGPYSYEHCSHFSRF